MQKLLMFLFIIAAGVTVGLLLMMIQFSLGKKSSWDKLSSSGFECGFSSYFNSRFSFSIHYFLIGLVFLFLDLELCVVMPFFNEGLNNSAILLTLTGFVITLLIGLIQEWLTKKLDWIE